MYDFLLFVHVLFAFGMVAAVTTFWALIVTTRVGRPSLPPAGAMLLGRVGAILVGVSSLGVLVFGVWLAIYVDGYELWDTWIAASLVLWLVSTAVGQRGGTYFERAARPEGEADAVGLRRTGLQLQVIASAALALIVVMMVFKPGA